MTNTTKLTRLALPAAIIGIGITAAVLLGRAGETKTATIPNGAVLVGALDQAVSTDHSTIGDHIALRSVEPVRVENEPTIPEGVTLHGVVTQVKGGGRIAGAPELAFHFTELEVDGKTYQISTDPFEVKGTSDSRESALEIGGGAVVGGVLRGVKGAIVGAALGTGVAVATKGDQLALAAGQHLRIRLTQSVTVQFRPRPETEER